VLISDLSCENIARQVNMLLSDAVLYEKLHQNCLAARSVYNWQHEEKKLIDFYNRLFQ
jgi:hypothetical protein